MTSVSWADSDFRRSVRNLGLRWQARLEGNGPDRAIPWILATLLFVGFGALSLARYRSLELGSQLAAWMQGMWLVAEGEDPLVSLTGRDLFDGQFSLIMWPLAKLSAVSSFIQSHSPFRRSSGHTCSVRTSSGCDMR